MKLTGFGMPDDKNKVVELFLEDGSRIKLEINDVLIRAIFSMVDYVIKPRVYIESK